MKVSQFSPRSSLLCASLVFTLGLPIIASAEESPPLRVNLPLGHRERVTGAAFLSPELVATCSEDATIIVWDVDTGCPLRRIFMPDTCSGMTLDAASGLLRVDCGTIRRGTVRATVNPLTTEISVEEIHIPHSETSPSADLVRLLSLPGNASLTLSEDDRILVGYEDGRAELWSTETHVPVLVQKFQTHISPTTSVAASGDWLASWTFAIDPKSHHLRFWNPKALRVIDAESNDSTSIVSGVFVNGGTHFVTCENSRFDWKWNLVVRNVKTGRVTSVHPTAKGLASILSIAPNGTRIVQTQYGLTGPGVYLWEFADGTLELRTAFPQVEANNAVFDPKRGRIYANSFVVEEEGLFHMLDAASGGDLGVYGADATEIFGTVVGMKIDPVNDLVLTSTFHRAAGYCAVSDLARGQTEVIEFEGIHSAFPRDGGRQLLLGGTAGTIRISLLDLVGKATLSRWEYPQSNYFREHLVAAVGWTMKKDAIALSDDEKTVYVVDPTGAIQILRISENHQFEEASRLVPLTGSDWAIVAADGNYACSPGGAEKMAFSRNQDTFPFEQFDLVFNRPDRIVEILGAPAEKVTDFRQAIEERKLKYQGDGANQDRINYDTRVSIGNRSTIETATADSSIRLDFRVEGGVPAGSSMTINTNGVEQFNRPLSDGSSSLSLDIPLTRGVNRIEAVATLPDGSHTLPEVLRVYHEAGDSPPDLYLLAVGVSDYSIDELDLSMAAKDARDVVEFLETQKLENYADIHTRLILDREATRENILAAADFFSDAKTGDTVIVFLAGHGMLESGTFEYHFGTTDIDPEDVADRGVAYSEIEKLFSKCQSGSRLILMDTCFAGEVETFDLAEASKVEDRIAANVKVRSFALAEAPSRKAGSMARLRRELFSDLRRSSGANVITASGGMEFVFAGEDQNVGNGLFTHCLLEGIRSGDSDGDGDGRVTVTELSDYLKVSLEDLSGGAQKPSFREVNRYSDFGVARCRAFPKLDTFDFLSEMLRRTQENGREEEYAALFTPSCEYFGSTRTRAEIAAEERAYHEKYDLREVALVSEPLATPVEDGEYRVDYRIQLFLVNSEAAGMTYVAQFDATHVIEQQIRMHLRYEGQEWLVSSMEVLDSSKKTNPHKLLE